MLQLHTNEIEQAHNLKSINSISRLAAQAITRKPLTVLYRQCFGSGLTCGFSTKLFFNEFALDAI